MLNTVKQLLSIQAEFLRFTFVASPLDQFLSNIFAFRNQEQEPCQNKTIYFTNCCFGPSYTCISTKKHKKIWIHKR